VNASNGATQFYIDVWTDKGGKGEKNPGGTYYVGEETTLYIQTNRDCKATLMIYIRPNIDFFNGIKDLKAGTYEIPLGRAEESDIGLSGATFQASAYNEGSRIDSVEWNVVHAPISTPAPTPIPMPTPQPQLPPSSELPTSPPSELGESYDTIDAGSATELLALTALKMAEGKLAPDPKLDADKDGQVTQEDARLILKWAVKKFDSEASQAGQQSETTTENVIPGSQPIQNGGQTVIPEPVTVDMQALVGKWDMTRQSIQPEIPNLVPDFLINQIIPVKERWVIEPANNNLTIRYGGRDTWYKKTFLLGGLTEGSTTALAGNQGSSYTFQTPIQYYRKSLPFPLNLLAGEISEIQCSATNSVNISVSGNDMRATIIIDNVQGTFLEKDKNGNIMTKEIHFTGTIVYKGINR
jgi:hypothetical protein